MAFINNIGNINGMKQEKNGALFTNYLNNTKDVKQVKNSNTYNSSINNTPENGQVRSNVSSGNSFNNANANSSVEYYDVDEQVDVKSIESNFFDGSLYDDYLRQYNIAGFKRYLSVQNVFDDTGIDYNEASFKSSDGSEYTYSARNVPGNWSIFNIYTDDSTNDLSYSYALVNAIYGKSNDDPWEGLRATVDGDINDMYSKEAEMDSIYSDYVLKTSTVTIVKITRNGRTIKFIVNPDDSIGSVELMDGPT